MPVALATWAAVCAPSLRAFRAASSFCCDILSLPFIDTVLFRLLPKHDYLVQLLWQPLPCPPPLQLPWSCPRQASQPQKHQPALEHPMMGSAGPVTGAGRSMTCKVTVSSFLSAESNRYLLNNILENNTSSRAEHSATLGDIALPG